MAARTTDALVLRTFAFAESSQIVHAMTRDLGRIHGIAKGARRLGGSFHGGFAPLTLGELAVYPRRAGADLRTLGAFDAAEYFRGIRESIPRFHAATHVAALVLAFAREEQPSVPLFDLTVSALRMLEAASADEADAYALGFEALIHVLSGFAPELSRCVGCDRPARNVVTAQIAALRGGLLCRACRGRPDRAIELSGEAVAALTRLAGGSLHEARELAPRQDVRRALRRALDAWTTTVLDRPLRTAEFLSP